MNILLTPFMDNLFMVFTAISLIFAVEMAFINISLYWWFLEVPFWMVLMFLSSYSIRRLITQLFCMQKEAEATRDSLRQILDNLPDAVIMLESEQL